MESRVQGWIVSALAAVVVAGACAPGAPSAGTTSGPSAAPATPSPAVATPSPAPTSAQERTVTVGTAERAYMVYAPPSLDRSKPSPLVLYLHGGGQTAAASERSTGLDAEADRQRFVLTYLQGVGNAWNTGCCTPAKQSDSDVMFVREVIRRTSSELAIDPARVYIAGFSGGGGVAYRVVCEAPELVAAIAAISGAVLVPTCAPSTDVSILEIHGTKDDQVPYGGCSPATVPCGPAGATIPPVEEMVKFFRQQFACPAPTVTREGAVTKTTASPCRGGTEVTLLSAEGGVHQFPLASASGGAVPSLQNAPGTVDPAAMVKFLLAHTKAPKR